MSSAKGYSFKNPPPSFVTGLLNSVKWRGLLILSANGYSFKVVSTKEQEFENSFPAYELSSALDIDPQDKKVWDAYPIWTTSNKQAVQHWRFGASTNIAGPEICTVGSNSNLNHSASRNFDLAQHFI